MGVLDRTGGVLIQRNTSPENDTKIERSGSRLYIGQVIHIILEAWIYYSLLIKTFTFDTR